MSDTTRRQGKAWRRALTAGAAAGLLLAACGPDTDDRTTTAAADTPEAAFQAAACVSCHGQEGEGGVGPALAGHTPEQVRNQVRDPVGQMPSFSESELPDDQLDLIIEYIGSLEGEGHAHDGGQTESTEDGHMGDDHMDEHMDDGNMDDGNMGDTSADHERDTSGAAQPDTTDTDSNDGHADDGHTH